MALYMNWDGVPGDVTTSGFEKWIELGSFQWGIGREIGSAISGQASRESSIPSISEVVVTKRMDSSSPGLWTDSVAGQLNTTVKVAFTTTSKGDTVQFLIYELTNTGLSGYSVSSGGDMPQELLKLEFHQGSLDIYRNRPKRLGHPGHSRLRSDLGEDDLISAPIGCSRRYTHCGANSSFASYPSITWAESTSTTTAVMLSSACPSSAAVTI